MICVGLNISAPCILTNNSRALMTAPQRSAYKFEKYKLRFPMFFSPCASVHTVFHHCLHSFPYAVTEGRLWASRLGSRLQVAACPPPEHGLTDLHCCLWHRSALASPNHAVEQWHPLKNPSLSIYQFLFIPPSCPRRWQEPWAVQSRVD